MSEIHTQPTVEFEAPNDVVPGSLAARAKARRQQLLERNTVILEPGEYEGIIAIEYRAISYEETRRIGERLNRITNAAERDLYLACDALIAACVQTYEIDTKGRRNELNAPLGVPLAIALGVEGVAELSPRQAMLGTFTDHIRLMVHYAEYNEWLAGAQVDVDEEQAADFRSRS